MAEYDTKLVKLNYQTFADKPQIADLILDLVTSNDQFYTLTPKELRLILDPLTYQTLQ